MKLLARLFSKSPSPSALPERGAMLRAGSTNPSADAAPHAGEEALRVAAIQELPDGEELRGLAGFGAATADTANPAPPAVQRAARMRMARLIDTDAIDFPAYCDEARGRPEMLSVAALCQDANRLAQAPASMQDPVQLRRLLAQVRGKDKNVYKILKHKCDALNAEERKREEIRNEIAAICAALERHSHRSYDPQYP